MAIVPPKGLFLVCVCVFFIGGGGGVDGFLTEAYIA